MMSKGVQEELIVRTRAFIENQETWLQGTINSVGWTIEGLARLLKDDQPENVCCPINSEHRMPVQSLESHVFKCEKRNANYPDVSDFDFHIDQCQNTSSILKTGSGYEVFQGSDKISKSNQQSSSSHTLAELLKAERDAKRRRAAHRGKRVHSNKKSYNETLREVIANETMTLSDDIKNEGNCNPDLISETQEPVCKQTTYLGVGDPYGRVNPYKRWITIQEEEKKMIERMQRDSNERKQKHEDRGCSSRRDHSSRRDYYRDDRRDRKYNTPRHFRSFQDDRGYKEDRKSGEFSRRECLKRKEKHLESREDYHRNEYRSRSPRHYDLKIRKEREDEDVHLECKRRYEESEESKSGQKNHKKKKKKKHKHKNKKRSQKSSSFSD